VACRVPCCVAVHTVSEALVAAVSARAYARVPTANKLSYPTKWLWRVIRRSGPPCPNDLPCPLRTASSGLPESHVPSGRRYQ
jgi:hypothetical protein